MDNQSPSAVPSTSNNTKLSLSCSICDKSFSRRDVLARHVRSQHQGPQEPKKRRRRARTSCLRCAFYKIKCVGTPTCVRCDKSGVVCQFDFVAQTNSNPSTPAATRSSHTQPPSAMPLGYPTGDTTSPVNRAEPLPTTIQDPPTPTSPVFDDPLQPDMPQLDFDFINPAGDSENTRHSPTLDWDTFNLQPPDPLGMASFGVADFNDLDALLLMNELSPTWDKASLARLSESSADEPAQLTPPQENVDVLGTRPWTDASSSSASIALPWLVPSSTLDMYKALEQAPDSSWLREVPKISSDTAQEYWDLFYQKFHPSLPAVHPGTIKIDHCHPLLLCSILAVGASYATDATAHDFSLSALSRLCFLLSRCHPNDPGDISNLTPDLYILISCITYYHIVCTKSSAFVDFVLGTRSSLLEQSRKMGLHSLTSNVDGMADRFLMPFETPGEHDASKEGKISLLAPVEGDMTSLWHMWIFREHQKRLAWAVIAIECRRSLMSGTKPNFTFAELDDLYLPCSEGLWTASEPSAWRSQFPWTHRPPRSAPFLGSLHQGDPKVIAARLPLVCNRVTHDLIQLVKAGLLDRRVLGRRSRVDN